MKMAALTAVAAMVVLANAARADIAMHVWDDGVNLFMAARGDYDLTSAVTVSDGFNRLGPNAIVGPGFGGLYGWETDTGAGSDVYEVEFVGALSGDRSQLTASITTTSTPFFIYREIGDINFPAGTPLVGTVDEFALFLDTTLADLGMIAGESVSFTWGSGGENERGTIATTPIPAPAGWCLLAFNGFCASSRVRRSAS